MFCQNNFYGNMPFTAMMNNNMNNNINNIPFNNNMNMNPFMCMTMNQNNGMNMNINTGMNMNPFMCMTMNQSNGMNMNINTGMNMNPFMCMNMSQNMGNMNNNMNMNPNICGNMNFNMDNDNVNLNIHFNEGNIQLQISSNKTIEELIAKIKELYQINYSFKLKYENKNLINSMTIAESGLGNGANIFVTAINESNNSIIQNNNKYSFSRYKKAAKTGLKNLGDTSYLNAVLQLLGTVKHLASYFVNPNKESFFTDNVVKAPLTYTFHRLNLHLYPFPEKEEREIYKPDSLLMVLGNYDEQYKSNGRQNPLQLLELCIGKIHNELNKKKNNI